MIQAVAFDIDGTLMDHPSAERAALAGFYNSVAEIINCPSEEEFASIWHAETERFVQLSLEGKLTFQQQRTQRVQSTFDRWGQQPSAEEAANIFKRYLALYEQYWSLYDDVLPCLRSVSHYPLGVISNWDGEQQREKLNRLGIHSFFSSVVFSGDIGIAKPNREIFERSAQELQVSPDKLLFVGDNLEVDAMGATNAGLHGVWLNRNEQHQAPEGVITVTRLTEVPGIIEDMNRQEKAP